MQKAVLLWHSGARTILIMPPPAHTHGCASSSYLRPGQPAALASSYGDPVLYDPVKRQQQCMPHYYWYIDGHHVIVHAIHTCDRSSSTSTSFIDSASSALFKLTLVRLVGFSQWCLRACRTSGMTTLCTSFPHNISTCSYLGICPPEKIH